MHRFVHVGLVFPGVPKMRDLEPVFDQLGGDWIRYAQNNWILWTNLPTIHILQRLTQHLDAHDQLLVVPLDMSEAFGRISPWIWQWIESKQPGRVIVGEEFDKLFLEYLASKKPPS